jgi:hypothetical protein
MICRNCGKESVTGDFCSSCGTRVSQQSDAPSGDPFPQPQPSSIVQGAKSTFRVSLALFLWAVIAIVGFVHTQRWSGGEYSPEAAGYLVGSIVTPGLLAWLIMWLINRSQKKTDPLAHRYLAISAVALLLSLLSFAGSSNDRLGPDSIQDHVRHLVRQASGKEAEVNSTWYDEPERELFRDMTAFNREYAQAVSSVDQTRLAKLYSTESYATKANIQGTIACLRELQEVDKKYESLDPPIKKFEDRINATNRSAREKEQFLTGVHSGVAKILAPRGETFRTEEDWLQSGTDLYEFTLAHFSDYTIQKQKLVFHSDASLAEFTDRQSKSIALRKVALEAKGKLDAMRQDNMSRFGLTSSDIPSAGQGRK